MATDVPGPATLPPKPLDGRTYRLGLASVAAALVALVVQGYWGVEPPDQFWWLLGGSVLGHGARDWPTPWTQHWGSRG